jgi:hypothetical protein
MAPLPPLVIVDPYAWERSTVTRLTLGELVSAGQLAANVEDRPAEWIVPPAGDRTPNPPSGYVVSFTRFHERGFAAPASRFMRALCHHYGVELHNFTPNAISQAATFVGVCEGYLGIPVNWDLWIHLFRAELYTQPTAEQRTRRAVHAGGMSLALRAQYKDDYIPCTMTTNNAGWERGWFYLRNAEPGLPPYTGLVLREKPDSWSHGVSLPSHRRRLDSVLAALRNLAASGLTAATVLAFLHHRWVVPPDGEATLHLRDDGDGEPRRAGEVTDAPEPPPAGVCGHTGTEHRRRPVAAQRPVSVGPRDAPHRPVGKQNS